MAASTPDRAADGVASAGSAAGLRTGGEPGEDVLQIDRTPPCSGKVEAVFQPLQMLFHIGDGAGGVAGGQPVEQDAVLLVAAHGIASDRKSTRLNSSN